MMRLILIFLVLISSSLKAQLTSYNKSETLDIGQLNLEWFGDSMNGPTDNNLQLKNSVQLIKTMDLDLLSLCEISDSNYWKRLLTLLPNYEGILGTYFQTQKTALLFKKDKFKLIYAKHILSQYSSDFASGRLPLEVALETQFDNKLDTLILWIIHLKANVGTINQKYESYYKRVNSGTYLKNYVDQIGKRIKGIVIGDWNDDFDMSIYNSNVTPFLNWVNDTNYLVATKILSKKKIGTTASYPDAVDHMVANYGLKKLWQKDSVFVVNPSKQISGYSSNTSDHFPVISRFYWNNSLNSIKNIATDSKFELYWNGNTWMGDLLEFNQKQISVYNEIGMVFFEGNLNDFYPPKSQIFVIKFLYSNQVLTRKFFLID